MSQTVVAFPGALCGVTDGGKHICVPSTQYTPDSGLLSVGREVQKSRKHTGGVQ